MLNRNSLFYAALLSTLVLFFLQIKLTEPPALKPATIASSEFSGERAMNLLAGLIRENEPHPVGSPLNRLVKKRIIDELNKHNIANSVQGTWACSNSLHRCAYIENIIAIIPGESDTGYVTLMSHYDSVPISPGAGDDGAAVASMLETGRILKSEAPFKKPILLLFTDAEENGLIGAEAFFKQHPLAEKVSVALNFEGTGTKGISQVIRTSGANKLIIDAYGNQTSHARGFSLTNEVLKRMSNDTDFSVVRRANIPGIDLAFAQERNHYHSPNDNLENLDPRTIQHHGENMLPTARWLANNDFTSDESMVFGHVYNGWTQWPATVTPYLIVLSFIFLLFAYMRTDSTAKGTAIGIGASLLVLVTSILVSYGVFELIAVLQGTTVSWPAYDLPYRITLFTSGLLGALLISLLANKSMRFNNLMTGAWFVWLALATLLYLYVPDAANLIVLPLIVGSLIYALSSFLYEHISRYVLLASLVLVVPATLGMVLPLEVSQGYRLIFVTLPFIALFMTIFVPLIHGAHLKLPISATAISLVSAVIIAIYSPLYSEYRPQHVNIIYFENLDNEHGYYWLFSQNPLPEQLTSAHEWSTEKNALTPYSAHEYTNWYQTDTSGFPSAEYAIESDVIHNSGRTLELSLTSARHARTIQLVLPATSKLESFTLGGKKFKPQAITEDLDKRYYFLRFDGVYERAVPLKLELLNSEPFEAFLIDRSTELPESASTLLARRSKLTSPQHSGDRAILIKRIAL